MVQHLLTRREVSARLLSAASVLALSGPMEAGNHAPATDDNGVARNCECIHQEVVIKASRAKIYRALTDTHQFKTVTELSLSGAFTNISPEVGGVFSLFGGLIVGRHIEMVPNERLV
ncbi:MAG TPA: hypothetical protein VM912_11440 [Terriglobales bacterium]|nr:hypothetical protein [Terriglobales bacterium]